MKKLCRFLKSDFIERDDHRRFYGTLALQEIPAHPLDSEFLTTEQVTDLFRLCQFDHLDDFVRIYRGSVDGFKPEDGHAKCDGVAKTMCIIQTEDDYIFGGFTNVAWESIAFDPNNLFSRYKSDPDAFIFSLVNKHGSPIKMECIEPKYAINCYSSLFPMIFGGGFDIVFRNEKTCSTKNHSYKHPLYSIGCKEANEFLGGSEKFEIKNIEVYRKIGQQ